MDRYRTIKRWSAFLIGLAVVFLFLNMIVSGYLLFRASKLTIETEAVTQQQSRQGPPVDPCESLRKSEIENLKLLAESKQKQALLMSKLALEIELSLKHKGEIPAKRVAELLMEYDTTETKFYIRMYKDVFKSK